MTPKMENFMKIFYSFIIGLILGGVVTRHCIMQSGIKAGTVEISPSGLKPGWKYQWSKR